MYATDAVSEFLDKPLIRNKIPMRSVSTLLFQDNWIEEEYGTETEAEKQMKLMLKKQLDTKTSVEHQFAQHRSFTHPSTFTPISDLVKGTRTLEKFKEIENTEEKCQALQRCGLTEDEIYYYLTYKHKKEKEKDLIDPSIWGEKLNKIEEKIKVHEEDLQKPQAFTNTKMITRHEMEIERTLYAGCSTKKQFSSLISLNKDTDRDKAFNHVIDLAHKYAFDKKSRKRKRQEEQNEEADENGTEFLYDPNIHHVTVPLEDIEVAEKCLGIEEIRKIPRFENYNPGEANKVLYLKNLHPKVTLPELRSLFGHFQDDNVDPIDYKLCCGRMKGQAFVTFRNSTLSEKALHYANGYVLRQKPIVIEFGRKS